MYSTNIRYISVFLPADSAGKNKRHAATICKIQWVERISRFENLQSKKEIKLERFGIFSKKLIQFLKLVRTGSHENHKTQLLWVKGVHLSQWSLSYRPTHTMTIMRAWVYMSFFLSSRYTFMYNVSYKIDLFFPV